jgi:hypothetical protein
MGKKTNKQQGSFGKRQQDKQKINKSQPIQKSKAQAALATKPNTTNLFKIIPEHDDFAALGYNQSDEEVEYHEQEGPEEFGGEESSESYQAYNQQKGDQDELEEEYLEEN